MDEAVRRALERDTLIDITTTGRRTGQPRRKEIWFHYLDGQLYLSGSPGARDWYANMLAGPSITFHLKQSLQWDIPARVTPITGEAERRRVFQHMREVEERMRRMDLEAYVQGSPLVQVLLED